MHSTAPYPSTTFRTAASTASSGNTGAVPSYHTEASRRGEASLNHANLAAYSHGRSHFGYGGPMSDGGFTIAGDTLDGTDGQYPSMPLQMLAPQAPMQPNFARAATPVSDVAEEDTKPSRSCWKRHAWSLGLIGLGTTIVGVSVGAYYGTK